MRGITQATASARGPGDSIEQVGDLLDEDRDALEEDEHGLEPVGDRDVHVGSWLEEERHVQ